MEGNMKNNHLSLDDRKQIQEGLEKELTRTEISKIFQLLQRKLNFIENLSHEIVLIIQLHVLILKNVEYVMENALNMKNLNALDEIEKLAFVIFVLKLILVD